MELSFGELKSRCFDPSDRLPLSLQSRLGLPTCARCRRGADVSAVESNKVHLQVPVSCSVRKGHLAASSLRLRIYNILSNPGLCRALMRTEKREHTTQYDHGTIAAPNSAQAEGSVVAH